MTDQRRSPEDRLAAILDEARSAPLPSGGATLVGSDPTREASEREDAQRRQIQAIGKAIRSVPQLAQRRRFRQRVVGVAVGVSAAAAALVFAIGFPFEDAPRAAVPTAQVPPAHLSLRQVVGKVISTQADGQDVVLGPNMGIHDGDQLSTTAEAFASLEFEAGTRVDLSSATTMKLVRDQELALRVGRVDINVPKLTDDAEQQLTVQTPNARVVVRGTIFSVEVAAAGMQSVTRVGVTRGAVSVFHDGREHTVSAGEAWTSEKPLVKGSVVEPDALGVAPEAAPTVAGQHSEATSGRLGANAAGPLESASIRVANSPAKGTVADTPAHTASSLAQQNRMFERGLRARDQRDDQRAKYWFDQLLRQYPSSPLAEAAQRERAAAVERLTAR